MGTLCLNKEEPINNERSISNTFSFISSDSAHDN